MFGRPRCREWTPLATQQLRLRSLVQIVGYNIRPPEWCRSQCSFYFTLHHTTMSAPFYTSERISSPHPKWKEIDSEMTLRMSSSNVVVRIWCHILHNTPNGDGQEKQCDTIMQTWGVYFSGLRFITANLTHNFTSDSFKSNTLVFQMHGGYFCSYRSLKLDVVPVENELEQSSLSSEASSKTSASAKVHINRMTKLSRSISPSKFSKKTDKEYSKSHSPVERGFKQTFPSMKTSFSLNSTQSRENYRREEEVRDKPINKQGNQIFEHSPDNLDVEEFTTNDLNCDSLSGNPSQEELYASKIDLSETAENYDLRNESDGIPKYRYMTLNFLNSEIRPSYNATKLQKLHLLQYSIKKRQEAVQETKQRIYQKSALMKTDDQVHDEEKDCKSKCRRFQSNLFSAEDFNKDSDVKNSNPFKNGKVKTEERPIISNGPRLALKLNDLLSFKVKPSPWQRAEHVKLTKQLEILRFKKIILSDERDAKLVNIRRLKEQRAKLCEENQDLGSMLMQEFHALSKRAEALKETKQSASAVRELAARSHAALTSRRSELLADLLSVFDIVQKDQSTWAICGVPLPICGDDNPRRTNYISESVAVGLSAHLTCLAAAMLNQPLRYGIINYGSASRIVDIRPDLPDPRIPLYVRGGDVTLFRYAMYLLNKCIVQLMWTRGIPVSDLRPTLANLKQLVTYSSNMSDTSKLFGTYKWVTDTMCPRTQSLRSLVASDRGKYRQFNRFKDTVDGHPPQMVMSLQRHRHSRSVGSYCDDQELAVLNSATTSMMGSEPSLYIPEMVGATELTSPVLKQHNSDSEISRVGIEQAFNKLSIDNKVIFTLGDETVLKNLDEQKLVRLSSNNGDCTSLDNNVKVICSEINDFCSTGNVETYSSGNEIINNMNLYEINEAFDVVKHMETGTDHWHQTHAVGANKFTVNALVESNTETVDVACNNDVNVLSPSLDSSNLVTGMLESNATVVGQDGA